MWALIATAWAWLRVRPGQVAAGHVGQAAMAGLVGLAVVIGIMWLRHDAVAAYEASARADNAETQLASDRASEDAAQAERARAAPDAERWAAKAADLERRLQALGGDDPVVFPQDLARSLNQ